MATAAPDDVRHSLDGEIAGVEQFIILLKREQALLEKGETESLQALVNEKNAQANALTVFSQARANRLAALGLPADATGQETWLDRLGSADDRRNWQRLIELARTARELNAANGRQIGLHLQHNQQALAALMAAADQASTYGPDGQQQAAGIGGRSLGKA